jgi:hypothetical protein
LVRGAGGPAVRAQKGAIERLATARGRRRLPRREGAARRQELSRPAPGQAGGSRSATGQAGNRLWPAFRPATGEAFTATDPGRTTANRVDFLAAVESWIDAGVERVWAVVDTLGTPSATGVPLIAVPHPRREFVFQPKYAAYLNLIEPWWKILRSLAHKGRRFEA